MASFFPPQFDLSIRDACLDVSRTETWPRVEFASSSSFRGTRMDRGGWLERERERERGPLAWPEVTFIGRNRDTVHLPGGYTFARLFTGEFLPGDRGSGIILANNRASISPSATCSLLVSFFSLQFYFVPFLFFVSFYSLMLLLKRIYFVYFCFCFFPFFFFFFSFFGKINFIGSTWNTLYRVQLIFSFMDFYGWIFI